MDTALPATTAELYPDMRGPMTAAQFMALPAKPYGLVWNLIDGEPVTVAPAGTTHAAIMAELALIIGLHFRRTGSRMRVLIEAGVQPRVRAATNTRVPDLSITAEPDRDDPLSDRPVIAIEVLSPSNPRKTWSNVWSYTSIPSVQEILVLESEKIGGEVIRRNADGQWPENGQRLQAGDQVELASIGLSLPLLDVYATTRHGKPA